VGRKQKRYKETEITRLKITAEKDHQSQYILTIEIEPAELEEAKGKAAKKLANQVRIPGFRPGKAPRALVERFVGQEALFDQATRDLLPKAFENAVKQEDIKPIANPEFDIKSNDPLVVVATIPVEPTVTLGNYRDLHYDLPPVEVTDDDVDKVIEQLLDQHSTWEEPEEVRPAQDGDQVELELQTVRDGEVTGKPFQRTGVLGKGDLIHQIDNQIVGMSLSEERVVEVTRQPATQPEEQVVQEPEALADAEETAALEVSVEQVEAAEAPETVETEAIEVPEGDNVPMTFKVVLNSIKVKHTPELDDAFAESVSDLKTVVELRERVLNNVITQRDSNNKRELTEKIIKEIVALSTIEMPPVLVNAEIEALESGMAERLKQQKLTLDQYLQFTGKNHEDFHEELRPQATERLQTALVLREIAQAEGITVEQGELDREVEKMVDQLMVGIPDDQRAERQAQMQGYLSQEQTRNQLREEIFSRKLAERLLELAAGVTPTEEAAPAAEAAAEEVAPAEEAVPAEAADTAE
jgi:trigger factor